MTVSPVWPGLIEAYRSRLPVSDSTPVITLQEGATPLLPAPELSRRTGCDVYLKVEGANPTGSFKDRGMTMAISKAVEEGSQAVICASTGNTSASAAAYAARAGLTCAVLVPTGKIAMGKLAQALVHGAKLLQVDGNFDDCLALASKLAIDYPVSLVNSVNQFRIEGQKTASFEIVDVLGDAPDIHCLPVGNAGNITAYWQGYARVLRRRPRHADAADVGLPGGRRRADRDRPGGREPDHDRHRHPDRQPRVLDQGARPPATSPAAASTPSPTARSSPPTGSWPAARRSSSSRRRRPRSPDCCRSRRPASWSPGSGSSAPSRATGSRTRSGPSRVRPAPVTIPVDAAAAAAQLGLVVA